MKPFELSDLQPFCSTDTTRPEITEPFGLNGHTHATDGCILIRVPFIEGTKPASEKLKNTSDLFPLESDNLKLAELPPNWESIKLKKRMCRDCRGQGYIKDCPECDGSGAVECECCGNDMNCNHCDGTGQMPTSDPLSLSPCQSCWGAGNLEDVSPVSLSRGEIYIDIKYLKLIMTLPGVKLYWINPIKPLLIKFDEGDGLIQPIYRVGTDVTSEQWPDEALTKQMEQL